MLKHDKEIWWRPGYVYYPAMNFTGVSVRAVNEGGAGNYAYGEAWAGSHTGAPISKEISTIGYNGILLDTAGDMVITNAPIPGDLDVTQPTYARIVWTSGSSDTADTVTWIALYNAQIPNVTELITPATALDKTIAAQDVPIATAYTLCKTAWGRINGGSISSKAEDWSWLIEMDAFDVGLSEDKFLLGLEIAYTPKRLRGAGGNQRQADFSAYKLSDHY